MLLLRRSLIYSAKRVSESSSLGKSLASPRVSFKASRGPFPGWCPCTSIMESSKFQRSTVTGINIGSISSENDQCGDIFLLACKKKPFERVESRSIRLMWRPKERWRDIHDRKRQKHKDSNYIVTLCCRADHVRKRTTVYVHNDHAVASCNP